MAEKPPESTSCRPTKSHALRVSLTHLSATSRSHSCINQNRRYLTHLAFDRANQITQTAVSLLPNGSVAPPSEWTALFPFISKGQKDPVYSFYCQVCQKDVSCRHQGIADVRRHANSGSHTSIASIVRSNSSLKSMGFASVGSAIDTQVKFSFMLEWVTCSKQTNCDFRATQRVPVPKFFWGGMPPDPPYLRMSWSHSWHSSFLGSSAVVGVTLRSYRARYNYTLLYLLQ